MYLGFDLGTSALKVLLIDEQQRAIASASAALTVQRPSFGYSEQEPQDWLTAASACLDELHGEHARELAAVRGIGLAGQMHGATLVSADDKPLHPCLLWNDTRAHAEAAELDALPEFRALSGNIVFPGFTAPKLLWLQRHKPELCARLDCVLLPKDYLRLWLTGERVSEMSDAAGTSWLDCARRRWSKDLLRLSNTSSEHLPRLVEGSEVSGTLRAELARRWGLGAGVVVAGGAGDNAAAAVGVGAVSAGAGFLSLGSSGVLFAASSDYQPQAESAVHTFCHALPQSWHHMGVTLAATDALNWAARLLDDKPANLLRALPVQLGDPGNLTFLPYLGGERTPHNDAHIRAALVGLEHNSGREQIVQAVLEGVSFAFADNLQALRSAGSELQRVVAVGGGSKSALWLQMLATVLDIEIVVPVAGDYGAALGAARLGLLAAEDAAIEEVCYAPEIANSYVPEPARQAAYREAWQCYQRLYQNLKIWGEQ